MGGYTTLYFRQRGASFRMDRLVELEEVPHLSAAVDLLTLAGLSCFVHGGYAGPGSHTRDMNLFRGPVPQVW
jgi:hypothetical protein